MATVVARRFVSLILLLVLLPLAGVQARSVWAAARVQAASPTRDQEAPPEAVPAPLNAVQTVDGDWWTQAQAAIQAAEYEITWQENLPLFEAAAAYQAPNRAHGLRTCFLSDGILIVPRGWSGEGAPDWRLRLAPVDAGPATLTAEGNRVTYGRPDQAGEWYRNEPAGLTQGFALAEPAGGQALVTLAVSTTLAGALAADGQAVDFTDAAGGTVLRYAGVQATDAAGHALPASLTLAPAGSRGNATSLLQVLIDAAGAAYPLTVTAALSAGPVPAVPVLPSALSPTPAWTAEGDQGGAYFGWSVATAGDVNGDGFTDIIVGAPAYDHGQDEEGRAFVFYGAAGGLKSTPAWTAESNQAGAQLGQSVATAGDVNRDGYADIIIGTPYWDGGQVGEGSARLYHGGPGGLGATPAWVVECDQANAQFGSSVAPAGDVNGDRYSDVIIGTPYWDGGQANEGAATLYHGGPGGLGATPAWLVEGDQEDANLGWSVGTAGDVNGDGYGDVIVGAPFWDGGQTDEGTVRLYYGAAGGLKAAPVWSAEPNQANAHFGASVATAGDVNGDGYADVIIGTPGWDGGQPGEGAATLYYGAAGGLRDSPAWVVEPNQALAHFGSSVATAGDVNGDGYADVIVGTPFWDGTQPDSGAAAVYCGGIGGLGANPAWVAEGKGTGGQFGWSVATAGDVNGDGYADVIIGAPGFDVGSGDPGRAYVYHGAAGGPSTGPDWSTDSNQARASFGWSVATAGDVNGDGYADVIVGAPNYDGGRTDEGRAFVFHGAAGGPGSVFAWNREGGQEGAAFGSSVAMAGDVNGDGYADVIVGANSYDSDLRNAGRAYVYYGSTDGLAGAPAWTAEGDKEDSGFGASVATAGDVNGDGYADVIVGADLYSNGQAQEGRAYVYYGSVSGLNSNAGWIAESDLTGAAFGGAVATAGDVNGDGYADVVIGAPLYANGQAQEGRAYVYYGSGVGLDLSPAWTAESNQAGATWGQAVAGAGDVNGDGYSDVMAGAPGWDAAQLDAGAVSLYYGSAGGLGSAPNWSADGGQEWARFGWSVAAAGDINGDGYADVIVGAPYHSNGQPGEGRAYVYCGSGLGPGSSPVWTTESNQTGAHWGWSVAGAGDVNGDGYADVIAGAPDWDAGEPDEGAASLYFGNGGGLALIPHQRRIEGAEPIAPGGRSDRTDSFRLTLLGRTPFGRGAVRLQMEAKPLGALFDGRGTLLSAWLDTGVAGATFHEVVSGLAPDTPYHWRVRLLYLTTVTPFQQASRWITVPWNGWNETDLRTGGSVNWLPLVLR